MISTGKTKNKFLYLFISLFLFIISAIGLYFALKYKLHTIPFIIIALMSFDSYYLVYNILIPNKRIVFFDDYLMLKWVRHEGKFIAKEIIPLSTFGGCYENGEDNELIIFSIKGEYLLKRISHPDLVIKELKPFYPDNAKIDSFLENLDFEPLDTLDDVFYAEFAYSFLKYLAKKRDLDDELFDYYLYLHFYNQLITMNIGMFIIYHRSYIERLKAFMAKLNLDWIPVYFDNIIKAYPAFDEKFLDNLASLIRDEENFKDFNEFNETIVNNANLILKVNEDQERLMIKEFVKYAKSHGLKEKLEKIKEEGVL